MRSARRMSRLPRQVAPGLRVRGAADLGHHHGAGLAGEQPPDETRHVHRFLWRAQLLSQRRQPLRYRCRIIVDPVVDTAAAVLDRRLGHHGWAARTRDHRPRRRPPAGHGWPYGDRDRADRRPREVQRCRAVSGYRRRGDTGTAHVGDDQQEARGPPDAGQTRGGRQMAASHQEQGPGHEPPVSPAVARKGADGLPHRAAGSWLEDVGSQPRHGQRGWRQAGTGNRPPGNHPAGAHRPGQPARRPAGPAVGRSSTREPRQHARQARLRRSHGPGRPVPAAIGLTGLRRMTMPNWRPAKAIRRQQAVGCRPGGAEGPCDRRARARPCRRRESRRCTVGSTLAPDGRR